MSETDTATATNTNTETDTLTYLCCPPGSYNTGIGCVPVPPCASPIQPCDTEWAEWSPCSVTCDGGFRSRSRNIWINGQCQPITVTEPCNTHPCCGKCIVAEWCPWSGCVTAPGSLEGIKTRTRDIIVPGCPGTCPPTIETESCCIDQCIFSEWSPWSCCSTCCNCGVQTRSRLLIVGDPTVCQPLIQTQTCSGCEAPTTSTLVLWNVLPTINPATGTLDCLSLIVTFQAAVQVGLKNYFAVRTSSNIFVSYSVVPLTLTVMGSAGYSCQLTRHSASSGNFLMLQMDASCQVAAGQTWAIVFPTSFLARSPVPANIVYVSVIASGNSASNGANTNTFTAADKTGLAIGMLTQLAGPNAPTTSALAPFMNAAIAAQMKAGPGVAGQLAKGRTAEDDASQAEIFRAYAQAAEVQYTSIVGSGAPTESSGTPLLALLALIALPVILAAVLGALWWKRRQQTQDVFGGVQEVELAEAPQLEVMINRRVPCPGTPQEMRIPVYVPSPKEEGTPIISGPVSQLDRSGSFGSMTHSWEWH